MLLINIIMRHFVDIGDEHLIGVEVKIEGDGTDAVFGARGTEIAQF